MAIVKGHFKGLMHYSAESFMRLISSFSFKNEPIWNYYYTEIPCWHDSEMNEL
jgi:hypothetical protein